MNNDLTFTFIITGLYESFHRKVMIENFADYVYPNKVFVINRPTDLISLLTVKKKLKESYSYKNITVVNSFLLLHDIIILKIPKILKTILFRNLKKNIERFYLKKNNIIWIMHPDLIDYLELIPHFATIYDSYDEFINKKAFKGIGKREADLVKLSNLIITSSKYLRLKKERLYNNDKYINSSTAIEIENFIKKTNTIIEKEMSAFKGKIIGFAGSVREDLNIQAIKYLAKGRPNDSIIFVGEVSSKKVINELSVFNNIHFLGKKRFSEFIMYLQYFDIAIMPHLLNDFILSSSPYKFYQYLAAGLYIVSSPIPELIDFQETELGKKKLEIAFSDEDFLEKVNYFLAKEKEILSKEEFISIDWENRFDNIFKELYDRKIITDNL